MYKLDHYNCLSKSSRLANETLVECAVFTAFGKEWIKSAKVSPDAFVQAGSHSMMYFETLLKKTGTHFFAQII